MVQWQYHTELQRGKARQETVYDMMSIEKICLNLTEDEQSRSRCLDVKDTQFRLLWTLAYAHLESILNNARLVRSTPRRSWSDYNLGALMIPS